MCSTEAEEENFECVKTLVAILAVAGSMSAVAFAADREVKVEDRLDASADALTI